MIYKNRFFVCFITFFHLILASKILQGNEKAARDFLENLSKKSIEITSKLVSAQWKFEMQNSENSKQELFQGNSEAIKNTKTNFRTVLTSYPWKSYSDPDIRRQLKLYSEIGMLALPNKKYQEFQQIMSEMKVIQQNTTICDYYNKTKCDIHLRPDIQQKLETSVSVGEISYLKEEWQRFTVPKFRKLLEKFVTLSNEAAVLNNYKNTKEYSLRNIEVDDPKQEMESLWESVKPLYEQIHAYVRRKLRNIFGEKTVPQEGAIPAQLLGGIWHENWAGIAHRLVPFPEEDDTNFTKVLINLNYASEAVRKLAEKYFRSMNFTVPSRLWYNETSREVPEVCHPKIFNFYNGDIRIKDCERNSLKGYLTDVLLLSKAEYMLQYSHQPYIYQTPANPGLENAVNDALTLSASTLKNLKKLGFYDKKITDKTRLNRLFKIAIERITTIPFLMVQEFWRWEIFGGKSVDETLISLNKLRMKFQGISTSAKEVNFNPEGIGSVFSEISLAHHFFSYFFEFQMYESFCPTSPLFPMDECSFLEKTKMTDTLMYIMSLGSSKSLKAIKTILFGENKFKAKSILNYFEPLMNWLKAENEKAGEFIGWNLKKNQLKKRRKKRSLNYLSEEKGDDSDYTPSKEPDRFQRLIYKRSKNTLDKFKESEKKRKSARNLQESDDQKAKSFLFGQQKQRRSSEDSARKSNYFKKQKFMTEDKNEIGNFKESITKEENKVNNVPLSGEYTQKNVKRHSDFETLNNRYDGSKIYSKIAEKESMNNPVANSKYLKCRSDYELLDELPGISKMSARTREKEGGKEESFFISSHKKRHSDPAVDEDDEEEEEEEEEKKERKEEENNNQIQTDRNSRNEERYSNFDSFDKPHQNSKVRTRTIEKDSDNSQASSECAAKKTNRRSDSETLFQPGENSQLYGRTMEKGNNGKTSNKYNQVKTIRNMDFDLFDESNKGAKIYPGFLRNSEKSAYHKKRENKMNEIYDKIQSETITNTDTADSGSINKQRCARRARKKQKRFISGGNKSAQNHHIRQRNDQIQNYRLSKNAQWHMDTKKDISRLLHSIGFSVENEEKDKIKELKKKFKGDSNSELKGAIVSNGNTYDNIVDSNKMKSDLGRIETGDDKRANKFWAMKTYSADNTKSMQSPSSLNKKDDMVNFHLSTSFSSKPTDEKSSVNSQSGVALMPINQYMRGNSESHFIQNGDNCGRGQGMNCPSFQTFLEGNKGLKQQMYYSKPVLVENKLSNDMSQTNQQLFPKNVYPNQFSNGFAYKYMPQSDGFQNKPYKDFGEVSNLGNDKSPYIIIVGQLEPAIREKLSQEKGISFVKLEKESQSQGESKSNKKKLSDKTRRQSDQIYIIPLNLKTLQLDPTKQNLYAEHEREVGHDPNTERDQESKEGQLHLEDDSKFEDKRNIYKTGKESPSEFFKTWKNDKNQKIVKRSKRDHKNAFLLKDNFKLVRLAPVKDPLLEGLLVKSLNQAKPYDKNAPVLMYDYSNGNFEYSPFANADQSGSMPIQIAGHSQTHSMKSNPSLSSLASSVISALSPKRYSQVSRNSGHFQDSYLENDALKEAGGGAQDLGKEQKEQNLPFVLNSDFQNSNLVGKKKSNKFYSDDDTTKIVNIEPAGKANDANNKKIILNSCPPKCPCSCSSPSPLSCPLPCPNPSDECKCSSPSPGPGPCPCPCPCVDLCSKKPSECSLVNCQFKITKAKKPHERLTIMVYDRINPPAELPEPYDALAVISEILHRIQCCSCKPCQLTEEDPDYPANDNMDQLKGSENPVQESKNKVQEIPIVKNESPEEGETNDNAENVQQAADPSNEDKYQPKEKATPAIDQLTVFNKDKLKPVFIELRKIDDILKKRSQQK